MSPTSTNRSPRHRLVEVGDSDLEAVKARLMRTWQESHVGTFWQRRKRASDSAPRHNVRIVWRIKMAHPSDMSIISEGCAVSYEVQ
ncbi:MAG: hypothetical protein K2H92_03110 [Bacteroidaceae bacterium]|nr:hypothetical protein [Bacteroidaceae bacterium]